MVNKNQLAKDLCRLLRELSRRAARKKDFSGIGLISYYSNNLSAIQHCSMRPSIPCPNEIRMKETSAVDFLLEISSLSNPLHDGFHFFNDNGILTHVSQYFVPPIVLGIKPNESYGTRYHSALYGSCIDGVIFSGVVSRCLKAFYFHKGKAYDLMV